MRRSLTRVFFVSVLVSMLLLGTFTVSSSADGELFHKVKWGETLGWIAWRYGVPLSELAAVNGISNTHWIYAGQELLIPGDWSDESVEHVVQPGETLLTIAARYGVRVSDIARRNGLWNSNIIYVGQILAIPGGSSPVPGLPVEAIPLPEMIHSEQIIIAIPGVQSAITSPVVIKGWGRSFDNNLAVEILDQNGVQLGQAFVPIVADLGQIGPFEGQVEFTAPAGAQPGRILVYSMHPRDGAMEHLASVEVMLQP